jgi:hypothetical protein
MEGKHKKGCSCLGCVYNEVVYGVKIEDDEDE